MTDSELLEELDARSDLVSRVAAERLRELRSALVSVRKDNRVIKDLLPGLEKDVKGLLESRDLLGEARVLIQFLADVECKCGSFVSCIHERAQRILKTYPATSGPAGPARAGQ